MNNMTKAKIIGLFWGVSLVLLPRSGASVILNFGNTDMTYDTVISNFSTWLHTASTLNVSGLDNHLFVTVFNNNPIDISGHTSVLLTAQVNGPNPAVYLQLEIFDNSLRNRVYDSFTTFFGSSPTSVTLTLNSALSHPLFDETDVAAFMLTGGGSGTNPLNMTFYQIEFFIIPEPSHILVCLVVVFLGAIHLIRRQKILK